MDMCLCVYEYVCFRVYTCVYVLCVFSSCQDPTDGELSLRSATAGETLEE